MNTNSHIRAVVLPRPLTPLSAFAYFLLGQTAVGDEVLLGRHHTRWTNVRASGLNPDLRSFADFGSIINLNINPVDLQRLVEVHMEMSPTHDGWSISADVVDFFCSRSTKEESLRRWLKCIKVLSKKPDARDAVSISNQLIADMVKTGIFSLPDPAYIHNARTPKVRIPKLAGVRYLTIPVSTRCASGSGSEANRDVVNYQGVTLPEAPIFFLEGQKIVLLIGGPPNGGKSTIAASLCLEMQNLVRSLQSRGGTWDGLNLRINMTTLDAATPVADNLLAHGSAQDRESMAKRKVVWTPELANSAVSRLEEVFAVSDIVIADLPGQISDITKLLPVHGTHAIVVGPPGDAVFAEEVSKWKQFFWDAGMTVVGQIKSTRYQPSVVGKCVDGRCVYGRIRSPARVVIGWDPFIQFLAQYLLFNILPRWVYDNLNA